MTRLQHFWEELTINLADIFDAHGICAAITQHFSEFLNARVIVGLLDPTGLYYDIWIREPNSSLQMERWRKSKNEIDTLIAEGAIRVVDKYDQPPAQLLANPLWQHPAANLLLIPLPQPFDRHKIITRGFLVVVDPDPDQALEVERFRPLSLLITALIQRAVLRYQRDRQAIEFALTSEISQSLTSTLNLEEIFAQVSADMRRILDVESLSLGLIDSDTGNIIFIPKLMGSMFLDIPPITLPPGAGIAGWVATHKEPVIVNDAYSDNRFSRSSDDQSGFSTRSILCVPLQEKDRVIGIMEAINKRHGEFTEHDKKLLDALSGPLTAAIINAELHGNVVSEKQRIETMFQSMSEGMVTIHATEGMVTAVNDAMLSLLQKKRDEIIGQPAADIIQLRDNDFSEFFDLILRQGHSRSRAEYPQLACEVRQDVAFIPVLASGAAVVNRDGDPTEAIVVFSDLRQIREVERMRDDFFHNIVHELRTPLALILMYARLLLQGAINDPDKSERFLKTIANESDRLQTMVRQMLQLAKLEAKEIQRSSTEVNLNEVFDEMLGGLADKATEKGLTFIQRIPEALPPIIADRDTIYMIFKNLVDNAIKFTLDGAVRVVARSEGSDLIVEVKDEGIGIPEEAMPNLFKRFYRAQTAVERGIAGTGIGLYMVKEGIEKHGGSLTVTSLVGEGTSFLVCLPAAYKIGETAVSQEKDVSIPA